MRTIRAPESERRTGNLSACRSRDMSKRESNRGDTLNETMEQIRSRTVGSKSLFRAGAVMALLLLPMSSAAQDGRAGTAVVERPLATRAQLQAQIDSLEQHLATDSGEKAAAVQARIERIRTRLEEGDFKSGDLVDLRVHGNTDLTDTVSVNRNRQLELGALPPVDLDGVLYSEVEPVLREAIAQYVREPNVRARPLLRVAVVGGVTNPGYYDLSPTSTLSEALMRAGGPSQQAKLDELEFRRSGRDLLADRGADDRPVETLSLAELGAQRGDQLFVPQGGGEGTFMTVFGIVSGAAGVAWAVSRVF